MRQHDEDDRMGAALEACLRARDRGGATLEETLTQFPESGQELADLLSLVDALAGLGGLAPRPEFAQGASRTLIAGLPDRKLSLRMRVHALLETRPMPLRLRTGTLIGVVVALILFFALTGGFLRTAMAAGPGDLLYKVNLRLEQAQLNRARSPDAAMRLHLDLALKRLDEVEVTLGRDDVSHALVALAGYEREIAAAAQLIRDADGPERDVMNELYAAAQPVHLDRLTLLLARVPAGAQAAIRQAIDALMLVGGSIVSVPDDGLTLTQDADEAPGTLELPDAVQNRPVEAPPVEPRPRVTHPPSHEGALPPIETQLPFETPDPADFVEPIEVPPPTASVPIEEPGPPIELPTRPMEPGPPIGPPSPPVEPGPPTDLPVPPEDAVSRVEFEPPVQPPLPPRVP